ncbi:hypothetical protein [Propionivibrio sp.]|uniref:hypothetical protein n=1 Tax=Propionivibrio sp. TaxID=2212460 RepID=UPI003BF5076A
MSSDRTRIQRAGFKTAGGGTHQSKTLMLAELTAYMQAALHSEASASDLIIEQNVLGKATLSARKIALTRLTGLYAVSERASIASVLFAIWPLDHHGRPLLALLAALARDPLLRESAAAVLPSSLGASVRWPDIAAKFEAQFPDRFSPSMLKSLSQNCASSWSQSGHLRGHIKKVRNQAKPTPAVAAYAALLATVCGFGGPTLLESPWMDVLDLPPGERLSLLRQAEAQGLVRLRTAGDMLEIVVRQPMAQTLRMPDLAEL